MKTILTKTKSGYLFDGSEKMMLALSNMKDSPFSMDGGRLSNTDTNTDVEKGDAIFKVGKTFTVEKGWRKK